MINIRLTRLILLMLLVLGLTTCKKEEKYFLCVKAVPKNSPEADKTYYAIVKGLPGVAIWVFDNENNYKANQNP
jgi:hypothetical protein